MRVINNGLGRLEQWMPAPSIVIVLAPEQPLSFLTPWCPSSLFA